MRVLLTTDPIGGVWTFTKELTTELLNRGHAVALVSFGRRLTPEQSKWAVSQKNLHPDYFRCDVSTVPLEWMSDNHLAPDGAQLLAQVAGSFAPDLVHSSQFCYGSAALDLPCVITAHSDVLSWASACRPDRLPPSPWLSTYLQIVQKGLSAVDAVAAPTRWMLDALGENFRLPPNRKVILNGRSAPQEHPPVFRTLQAVTSGRIWDEAKNLSLLQDVQAPMPVIVAGEVACDRVEARHNIGPASLIGSLSEETLMALFAASSIYIVTSVYEPFGLAPLEAALQGCAVVANDIPSLREVWADAAVYFRDADELTRQLTWLHGNPFSLGHVQRRCHARALQFTAEEMTNKYLGLYQELLQAKLGPSDAKEVGAHAC